IWKNGEARITAKLDDWAFYIKALLCQAQFTGNLALIQEACTITAYVEEQYRAEETFFYFTPAGQADLPVRKIDLYDGALPSANAIMAENLWILGMVMERPEWIDRATKMVMAMEKPVRENGNSHSYWAKWYTQLAIGARLVVCVGEGAQAAARDILAPGNTTAGYVLFTDEKHPQIPVLENKKSDGYLSIFVCTQLACEGPYYNPTDALLRLRWQRTAIG
ncbi:MAG: hypothetical protein EBZ77_17610, partial [Chitinophagia bacterium]|nr:hypothetical protein [Chitinophagia bacterium]